MQCAVVDRVVLADEAEMTTAGVSGRMQRRPRSLYSCYSTVPSLGLVEVQSLSLSLSLPTSRAQTGTIPAFTKGTLLLTFCVHVPEIALHTSTCNIPWDADA